MAGSNALLRVVFDTNVLISASLFRGKPHLAVRLADGGGLRSITSQAILGELAAKLVEKFEFGSERASAAAELVRGFSDVVELPGRISGVCRDSDDDAVIETASVGCADYLVTGDHDLLSLHPLELAKDDGSIQRIQIINAAAILRIVAERRQ